MTYATLEEMVVAAAEAVRPPERITVSEAAERYHIVKNPGQHEGPFSLEKTPYLREPMDVLTSLDFTGMAFVGPARTGKSAMAINWLCHTAITDPADMMIVHMAQHTARDWSQADLAKALRNSPELRKRVKPGRQQDNTYDKSFLSGMRLTVTWPTITNLSGKTIPRLWIMDMDRIKPQIIEKEGHVFDLTRKRAGTFKRYGMTAAEASPGFPVTDPRWMPSEDHPHEAPPCDGILSIYNRGDRRRWYWKCPHCSGKFQPKFNLLRWPDSRDIVDASEQAFMACPHCFDRDGALIMPRMQSELNLGARWIKEGQIWLPDDSVVGTARRSDIASFWMFGPAAGFTDWPQLVRQHLLAMEQYEKTGDEGPLMTTVTVDQGDAYVPKALEAGRLPEELKRRAQDWGGSAEEPCVPAEAGGGFLIATVDVQAGGRPSFVVHVYLVSGGDIWHVDMFKIRKSRRKDDDDDHHLIDPGSHPEDWDVLIDQVIERDYPIGDTGRRMQIKIVACDSGGADGVTANAYAFYRRLRAGTAIAKKRLPPVKPHLQKYLEYIRNTGRDPLPIAQFDEDWEPIGKQVREELLGAGAINWDKGNLWIDYVTTEPTGLHRRFHLLKGSPSRTETAPLRLTYPDAQQKDRLAIARGDVPVWLVNSNIVKDQASNMLGREEAGGAVRFPSWAPDWLYTQLTTEIREPKGWTNPSRRRNEAFDLLAYAIAMQRHPDLRTHVVGFWDAPPDWAGPWDVNSLVYTPTPEGGRRFEAPQASRPSLADLADKLG